MPDDSTPANTHSNSAAIRQQKRALRRRLSDSVQLRHSQALHQNIRKEKAWRCSQHIAFYLANDGEIDPYLLLEHARFQGKKSYLPILAPVKNSLYFAPYNTGEKLKPNRFNILEPVCHPSKWKTASQLDLLLLPLVAFDPWGNRIGMGGGYYDRTLAYMRHRRYWKKPTLMGLAHEIQKVEHLHSQYWDIPLEYVITEKQRYPV